MKEKRTEDQILGPPTLGLGHYIMEGATKGVREVIQQRAGWKGNQERLDLSSQNTRGFPWWGMTPVAMTPHSQCRGPGFNPLSGN